MGLFGDVLSGTPFGSDENSGGWLTDVFDPLDFSGTKSKNAAAGFQAKQNAQREKWKQTQYNLLGQRKRPELTPQQQARIAALENESKLNLIEDPAFQSQMRQATSGGAQALSSIQNQQAASGATGGFANQGSIADVYDRLGVDLANLAQDQTAYKEQKRDVAADMRQDAADAQIAFDNAINEAKLAIEAGDNAAVSDAMNRAYAAQEQIESRKRNSAVGAVGMIAGAYTGNPGAVKAGSEKMGEGSDISAYNSGQGPTQQNYNSGGGIPYNQGNYFGTQMGGYPPWSQMKGGR